MNKIIMGIIIWFAYLSLSTYFTLYNLVFGAVLTLVILKLMPVRRRKIQVANFTDGLTALIQYLWMTAKNTLLGGIQVTSLVLSPNPRLKTGIIVVDPDCDHELGQALSAHAISLSPGELLVETGEDGKMYIHSLNVEQTLHVTQAEQKQRKALLEKFSAERRPMDFLLTQVLYISLGIHVLLMAVVALRLWNADHSVNRLIASDILSNLGLAVLVLAAMIHHQYIFLHVALGLAALGFISIIAFARFMADKKIF